MNTSIRADVSKAPFSGIWVSGKMRIALAAIAGILLGGLAWHFLDGGGSKAPAKPTTPVTVAVLPVHSLSVAPEDAQFDSRLTDALTGSLAKDALVHVFPGELVQQYVKSGATDPVVLGRDLRVHVVVIGLVEHFGALVRVNVQIVNTKDGSQKWAAAVNGDPKNFAGLSRELSDRIYNHLR